MTWVSSILMGYLVAANPCSNVEQTAKPDSSASRVYSSIGDEEHDAGGVEAATVAYREALRQDPSNEHARRELDKLCDIASADQTTFDEGMRLMQRGNPRAAIAAFESLRAPSQRSSAALLAGICYYQLREDEAAKALLREAEREPALADSAHFYLGMLALRAGDKNDAAALFNSTAGSMAIGGAASNMLRFARREEGSLVLSFLEEAGYNSNVSLLPTGVPAQQQAADGVNTVIAAAHFTPYGQSGPFARLAAGYEKQFQLSQFDLGFATAAVGGQIGRNEKYLRGQYAYDFMLFGGTAYLSAHQLSATASASLDPLTLRANSWINFESFLPAASADYSGLRYVGELESAWRFHFGSSVGLAYRLSRDNAHQSFLSWVEHSPRARVRLRVSNSLRLSCELAYAWRDYDSLNPDFTAKRADQYLDGAALGELELGDRWTMRLSVTARKAISNIPDYGYSKVAGLLGLSYTLGVW